MSLEVRPGECALIDGREAYWLEYDKGNSALGFSLPEDWLTTWLPDTGAIRPQVLKPGHGWGGVLANSLGYLTPEDIRQMSPGGMSLLADHLGSLLALAASEEAPRDLGTARTALLDRMRDTIKGIYYDATLTPAAVADQHGVSVRFLHLLFAKAGSSFGRELLTRRLEAAYRMLRDPRFGDLAVNEIARRNGFRNASHFARHFRKRFGMSPVEARAYPAH